MHRLQLLGLKYCGILYNIVVYLNISKTPYVFCLAHPIHLLGSLVECSMNLFHPLQKRRKSLVSWTLHVQILYFQSIQTSILFLKLIWNPQTDNTEMRALQGEGGRKWERTKSKEWQRGCFSFQWSFWVMVEADKRTALALGNPVLESESPCHSL